MFSIWEVNGFGYPIIFMTKRRIMIVTYEAHVSDPFRNIGNDGSLEADCFCENTLETKEGGNYQLSPALLKKMHILNSKHLVNCNFQKHDNASFVSGACQPCSFLASPCYHLKIFSTNVLQKQQRPLFSGACQPCSFFASPCSLKTWTSSQGSASERTLVIILMTMVPIR